MWAQMFTEWGVFLARNDPASSSQLISYVIASFFLICLRWSSCVRGTDET